MFFTYMLRCEDDTIYTGIAKNINHRMSEHFSQNEKCAKYTKRHKAKKLEAVWESNDRQLASKLEYHIKKDLNKKQKEDLIINNNLFKKLFNNILDTNLYKRINIK